MTDRCPTCERPKSYNGWTDDHDGYPTWSLFTWLTNDPGTYSAAREVAGRGVRALRRWAEELIVPESAGPDADILRWALRGIDWRDLTEALTDE